MEENGQVPGQGTARSCSGKVREVGTNEPQARMPLLYSALTAPFRAVLKNYTNNELTAVSRENKRVVTKVRAVALHVSFIIVVMYLQTKVEFGSLVSGIWEKS